MNESNHTPMPTVELQFEQIRTAEYQLENLHNTTAQCDMVCDTTELEKRERWYSPSQV